MRAPEIDRFLMGIEDMTIGEVGRSLARIEAQMVTREFYVGQMDAITRRVEELEGRSSRASSRLWAFLVACVVAALGAVGSLIGVIVK